MKGLERQRLVEEPGDDQDLRRGQQGKGEGELPGPGSLAEGQDFGVIGGCARHEKGEAVPGGSCPGEKIGGQGAGAFGADLDDSGGEEGESESGHRRTEPLGKGRGVKDGPEDCDENDAQKDPADDHAGLRQGPPGVTPEEGAVKGEVEEPEELDRPVPLLVGDLRLYLCVPEPVLILQYLPLRFVQQVVVVRFHVVVFV